jgi:hypothetical protein
MCVMVFVCCAVSVPVRENDVQDRRLDGGICPFVYLSVSTQSMCFNVLSAYFVDALGESCRFGRSFGSRGGSARFAPLPCFPASAGVILEPMTGDPCPRIRAECMHGTVTTNVLSMSQRVGPLTARPAQHGPECHEAFAQLRSDAQLQAVILSPSVSYWPAQARQCLRLVS